MKLNLYGTGFIPRNPAEQWKNEKDSQNECHLRGSNTGPSDLQSDALPAELKRLEHFSKRYLFLTIHKDETVISPVDFSGSLVTCASFILIR